MNIRSLVPELIKTSLCIGLTVFATTTPAGGFKTASVDIISCTTGDSIGNAFLWEPPTEEGIKKVGIFMGVNSEEDLKEGKHGVHIHKTGACTPIPGTEEKGACTGAGGHFDPDEWGETSPNKNHPYHLGDLPNIHVKSGKGYLIASTTRVTLSDGPLSLNDEDGSAFIIHVDQDYYCSTQNLNGSPRKECVNAGGEGMGGAGGARAACGIIYPDTTTPK